MGRRVEIKDPPSAQRSGGRNTSSEQLLSRCGEAPEIAAAIVVVAFWSLPQLELRGIPLLSRLCCLHPLPTPSLATMAVQRKKGEVQKSRSTNEPLPCWLRAPRVAPPSPLTSMTGQRKHRVAISPRWCVASPSAIAGARSAMQVQLPPPPWLAREELAAEQIRTCRKTNTAALFDGVVVILPNSNHGSSSRTRMNHNFQISP
jgi:hypothetical protein